MASVKTGSARPGSAPAGSNGDEGRADEAALHELLRALRAAKDGDFTIRLPQRRTTLMGQIGAAYNELVELNASATKELGRVARLVGREGRMNERFALDARGAWGDTASSVNRLIEDLSRPTTEVARVIEAVARSPAISPRATRSSWCSWPNWRRWPSRTPSVTSRSTASPRHSSAASFPMPSPTFPA